jgi:hypothetical protein
VLKRPKKRLVKANAERRAAFVREYALLRAAAHLSGAKLFFADLCEVRDYADRGRRAPWLRDVEAHIGGVVGRHNHNLSKKARSGSGAR